MTVEWVVTVVVRVPDTYIDEVYDDIKAYVGNQIAAGKITSGSRAKRVDVEEHEQTIG